MLSWQSNPRIYILNASLSLHFRTSFFIPKKQYFINHPQWSCTHIPTKGTSTDIEIIRLSSLAFKARHANSEQVSQINLVTLSVPGFKYFPNSASGLNHHDTRARWKSISMYVLNRVNNTDGYLFWKTIGERFRRSNIYIHINQL